MAAAGYRYIGDSLASLVSEASLAATDRATRSIAEDAQRTMLRTAVAATPVRSGATRESWLAPMVEHHGSRTVAKVQNHHWLAYLLNNGVQEHEIFPEHKPGRHAEMTPEGPRGRVHHPGVRAHRMIEKAAEVAEATLPFTADRHLEAWRSECEAAIEAGEHR